MKPKDLVTVSDELNALLFDPKKKEEGWIDTTGSNVKKMTKGIKEAAAILEFDDTITEETQVFMRELDWSLDDYEAEDAGRVQETLQKMGVWVNEDAGEYPGDGVEEAEVVEEEKSEKEDLDKEVVIIEEDTQILTLRDNAKAELAQIKTIEGGIEYLHKVQSIATWMQAEKKDAELQNMVAEQKLRTQRILGELVKEGQKSGEIATRKVHGKGIQSSVPQGNTRKTLEEIGISRKQSSTYKQIAEIPEKEFDSFIEEKKEAVDIAVSELTTKGAVQLAKNLKKKPGNGLEKSKGVKKEVFENANELRLLAETINDKFNKKERDFLKSLIN